MNWRVIFPLVCLSFLFLFAEISLGQTTLQVSVISIEETKPFPITHLHKTADRKVLFRFFNATNKPIKIFGSEVNQDLQPIRYLLRFDKNSNDWSYPTPSGKPVKWKNVSAIYKRFRVLQPGKFLDFSAFFSSIDDCGQKFKVTIQMGVYESKKTVEVRSEEFTIGECKKNTSTSDPQSFFTKVSSVNLTPVLS